MLSFLFWNLNENPKTAPLIGRLAIPYTVDVFLFAECPVDPAPIVDRLNAAQKGTYRVADIVQEKVRVITRLPESRIEYRYTSLGGDMAIWRLEGDKLPRVLVAAAHLLAKSGGVKPADQQSPAQDLAREIAEAENREETRNTILVGDLNMNPFDDGMVMAPCFFGALTEKIAAKKKDRKNRGRLWTLLADPHHSGHLFLPPRSRLRWRAFS